jgi:type II secretory pathway pseudopilin PulG
MKPYQISRKINRKPRNAFTLVELMVAMALIILMLSIMSQAFVIATGTMQGLKEVADMQEKIRPAITLLQRDLGANHFEGSKKLSDPEFWDNGPPKEGYFMLWQDKANDVAEGATNNVTFSQSAAAANHMLAFTVKLPGKSPIDFFEENLALPIIAPIKLAFGNTFFNGAGTPQGMIDSNIRRFETTSDRVHSDWAEVAYFLGPHNVGVATPVADGNTDGKNNPPSLPYFNLYRQQKLVLPSFNIEGAALPLLDQNLGIISANPIDNNANLDANLNPKIGILLAKDYFSGLSFHLDNNSKIEFNKPSDLTVPWKRMGNRTFTGLTANRYLGKPAVNTPLFSEYTSSTKVNTDIIATNVISFDVKLLTDDQYDYETLNAILNRAPYSLNPAVGNYLPSLVFDTWTTDQGNAANSIPKYDLGELNTIPNKWQPSTSASNATIPVWGWKWDSVTNSNRPYKAIQIKAVQISLRIWDQKSNTAKMFVIVQKL